MLDHMTSFFVSGFIYPGLSWSQALFGIGISIVFGSLWFTPFWTSILKKPWAWVIMITSIILTWTSVAFIQIPLQFWSGQALGYFWTQDVIMNWILLAGIPQILLSGLVQEGGKLLPIIFYWWRNDKEISPQMGLAIGVIAGLGFGVFEAIWVHNRTFAAGWNWEAVQAGGFLAFTPFWERLSAVALHIGASALAGYGLAKGWGWQFYLLAAFLHSLINYSAVLSVAGLFTIVHVEIYVSIVAILVISGALWLRWRRNYDETPV
ncbi:PrsW family glutamic-type intramembrane protease [Chloroflexota bacterium]